MKKMKMIYTPPISSLLDLQVEAGCLTIASPGDPGAAGSIINATDPYELP